MGLCIQIYMHSEILLYIILYVYICICLHRYVMHRYMQIQWYACNIHNVYTLLYKLQVYILCLYGNVCNMCVHFTQTYIHGCIYNHTYTCNIYMCMYVYTLSVYLHPHTYMNVCILCILLYT